MKYFYKADKRLKKMSYDVNEEQIKELKANGYVEVTDKNNPEGSIVKPKAKPKPKSKPKKKAKKK